LWDNPRALNHLRQAGHFEFGPDRRPINTGDIRRVEEVSALWQSGEEVRGWARYWAHVYGYVAGRLAAHETLREATLTVRYEDLCHSALETARSILAHCRLHEDKEVVEAFCARVSLPDYYDPRYSDEARTVIEEETAETARRFGYPLRGTE